MGVKSTVTLTEKEAIEKYVDLKSQLIEYVRQLKSEAVLMSTEELENVLEEMNDKVHDGEGYENYSIIEDE